MEEASQLGLKSKRKLKFYPLVFLSKKLNRLFLGPLEEATMEEHNWLAALMNFDAG